MDISILIKINYTLVLLMENFNGKFQIVKEKILAIKQHLVTMTEDLT